MTVFIKHLTVKYPYPFFYMRTFSFLFPILLIFLFIACNEDGLSDMGSSIQPIEDQIVVLSERFDISSEDYAVTSMFSRPDSFLLGTFYDEKYGTIHADIFAQVEHPKNHVYPANTKPDSIILVMYYRRFFGDKFSPMNVSVYEMNKATFNYSTPYASNLNPDNYVDRTNNSLLIGQKSFTAVDAQGIADSTYVIVKLTDEFLERFTNIASDTYSSEAKFLEFFKGLWITTDFGSASMLYIRRIDLEYYHSYTYTTKGVIEQDSTVTVNSSITFPANSWVRQVNRFIHPNKPEVLNKLANSPNQIHYISSPANIYTRINLPIKKMQEKMEINGRRLAINNAKLRVDIHEIDQEKLSQPLTSNILMIKESALDRFFTNKELPSDTCAVLGSYAYEKNTDSGEIDYFYSFDIAGLIAHEFKNAKNTGTTLPDDIKFLMVPVRIKTNSNGNVTEVAQQFLLSAVTICGGNHNTRPIKANVVFSGF